MDEATRASRSKYIERLTGADPSKVEDVLEAIDELEIELTATRDHLAVLMEKVKAVMSADYGFDQNSPEYLRNLRLADVYTQKWNLNGLCRSISDLVGLAPPSLAVTDTSPSAKG